MLADFIELSVAELHFQTDETVINFSHCRLQHYYFSYFFPMLYHYLKNSARSYCILRNTVLYFDRTFKK